MCAASILAPQSHLLEAAVGDRPELDGGVVGCGGDHAVVKGVPLCLEGGNGQMCM